VKWNKWSHCYILEAFLEDSEGTLSASSATGAAAAAAAMALSSSLLMVLADFLKQKFSNKLTKSLPNTQLQFFSYNIVI